MGLTTAEADRRRARSGPNSFSADEPHPLVLALGKLWAPVPWMLEAAVVLEVVFGQYAEAAIVAVLLLFNAAVGFVQERRAQTTLTLLKTRLAPTASVRRDGRWTTLPAEQVVPGDVLTLSLGTVVPADARILSGSVLVDQSLLTGESQPVDAGPGGDVFGGAMIRRGEAVALTTATGTRTRFGRGAELVRNAKAESTEQKAIFRVVRNLALVNGCLAIVIAVYGVVIHLTIAEIASLFLVALLASIPVALPSMFTLAEAVGARHLAARGVLPTRLSTLDEAAGVDVLCSDKTGTLTMNSLTVGRVLPLAGLDSAQVLALGALASSAGGADPVDAAVRAAAAGAPAELALGSFRPFDPSTKMATATATRSDGTMITVVKGAYAVIAELTGDASAAPSASQLERDGFRVLGVAAGPEDDIRMCGLLALSDPPRPDSAALIEQLAGLGVRTVMVTGDAPGTAAAVAGEVGIAGEMLEGTPAPDHLAIDRVGVLAGVLPEDKYRLVKLLQGQGHIVAVCGDGVNDAPALRQAQLGIAVLSATDVAKSAAGVVLTEPGLGGIVAVIREGRFTFQRILTYTLRSVINKVVQVMFLLVGLLLVGHAIITPVLMVIMMVAGDFLAMSSSTDNVRPSAKPNVWRIGNLTVASIVLGACDLAFCLALLILGRTVLDLDLATLRTFAVVTLVFAGQAVFYVSRERRHIWSSRPSNWVLASSVADIGLITLMAVFGVIMAPLPLGVIAGIAAAAVGLAFVLDALKGMLFRTLRIA